MLPAPHNGDQDEPEMRLEGEAEVTQGESGIRGTEVCSPSLGFNPSQETLLTDKDVECQELCVGRRSVHMLNHFISRISCFCIKYCHFCGKNASPLKTKIIDIKVNISHWKKMVKKKNSTQKEHFHMENMHTILSGFIQNPGIFLVDLYPRGITLFLYKPGRKMKGFSQFQLPGTQCNPVAPRVQDEVGCL